MKDYRFILSDKTCFIKHGKSTVLDFNTALYFDEDADNYSFRLRLRGDTDIHPAWLWEGGLPLLYRDIDDSLSTDTHHSRFSLKIATTGDDIPRRAYCKRLCPFAITTQYDVPKTDDTLFKFHCTLKANELTLLDGGKAEVRFELYQKHEGHDIRDISGEPYKTITADIPQGSYDWRSISSEVTIDDNIACILVIVNIEHAVGEVWLEDPSFKNSTGFNMLPQFDISNQHNMFLSWTGENLSHKEWNDIALIVNGKKLPAKPLFQRCFAGSENEIAIPYGWLKNGENSIEIINESDYFSPVPYKLMQTELLMEKILPVQIISAPFTAVKNESFAILIKTLNPNTLVTVESDSDSLEVESELLCCEAGLNIINVKAGDKGFDLKITVSADGYTESVTIERIVHRENDGVLTGSGDSIYVPQEIDEMERFIEWYTTNHLGSMITFRPVYRWSGSYSCNPETWARIATLCNALKLNYCHIIDGRELSGINANPTKEMLKGEYFMGNQGHERDGAYYYWKYEKAQPSETFFQELMRKDMRHPDFNYYPDIEYSEDNVYYNYSFVMANDMEEAAEQFVRKSRAGLKGIKRHTGPGTTFRYMFKAGLEVGGAELLYGPQEVILAALRGASIAYDRKEFAAHLAIQWSTTPHDTIERYRRYQLSLFICYIQGVHHINTEEGLYRMEEYFSMFDRFSEPCLEHSAIQREFVKFTQTHTRSGQMSNKIAMLQGENDGWICFTRAQVWGQDGKEWEFNTPEESWDLIKVFYPDSVLDAIYRHPCPNEPQGFYTRTPYGSVDILPIEASSNKMNGYSAVAFLSFNTANQQQIKTLTEYVQKGGTLMLGWPQLFTDKDRQSAIWGTPHPLDASSLTGVKLTRFMERDNDGLTQGEVILSNDVCVLMEKNGIPLVVKRQVGIGSVIFVNSREYAADKAIREVYEKYLAIFGEQVLRENSIKGFITGSDTVETAVYDRTDENVVIYAVNTDWWSKDKDVAEAVLLLNLKQYPVSIPRGIISIFTINDGIAIQTMDMDTEVIEIIHCKGGFKLHIQGAGETQFNVFCNGEISCPFADIRQMDDYYVVRITISGEKEIMFDID